ncbi:MAG TPA: hypothetical protein PL131_11225 [Methylotenera sp.]|nr:hypothetical protein [Methylotenera sp.]HPH06438.1 hypothetical protein [Methylotenera sp.]HPN00415.1 hypothetical protein [Methylotenera sp.]
MKHIGAGIAVAGLYAFIAYITVKIGSGGIFTVGFIIFALICTWKLVESAISSGGKD